MDSDGKWLGIETLDAHYINRIKYKPLRSNFYLDLPKELKHHKKGLINIKNEKDNECFRWCHLAYEFPANNKPQRITKYKKYIGDLNYEGITFPVTIKQIPKIEKQNNICFNIFGYEDNQVYPLHT